MAATARKTPNKTSAKRKSSKGSVSGKRVTRQSGAAAKRVTRSKSAATSRNASGRGANAARKTRSATNARAKTPRNAGRRATRTTLPRNAEPIREEEFITALDWISDALGDLFHRYGREIAMVTLMILTLCDLLTLPGVFAETPSEGILVGWLSVLFRGLFGYGYLATLAALPLALLILWRRENRPVALPVTCTLLLPFLFGILGHLILPGASLTRDEGFVALVKSLWFSGQALISGGVLSGGIAELCRAFFSQFVALVLLLIVFSQVWRHMEISRRRRLSPEARRGYVDGEWEDEDDAPIMDYSPDDEYDLPDDEYGAEDDRGIAYERGRPGIFGRALDWLDDLRYGRESASADYGRGSAGADYGRGSASADYGRTGADEEPEEEEGYGWPVKEEALPPKRSRTEEARKPVRAERKPSRKAGKPDASAERESAEPEPLPEPDAPPEEPPKKKRNARKKAESGIEEAVRAESARVSRDISRKMARESGDYLSPSVGLLARNQNQIQREDKAELARNARRLEETLTSFDVNAVSAGEPVRGPSITRYEFRLEQGVKLSKIMNLADDIALSLGSGGVRIAPIQNRKSVVGIEVPNSQKTPVLLRDVVESPEFLRRDSATTFALGKDISGDIITGSIEELPHVLIAGTTGSGKSVCTNSMIISLLYKSAPEQLRFIMIDPKMVELAPYNGIPHLLIPVVTDPRKAAGALQWAVAEMMRRYKAFSENGVKKLAEYQRLTLKKKELQPLPSVVVVIDELADLMMVAAKEVEESIMRVAQMGRAAGIHLVIATQRPSADVITGLMKANIPSRIAFAVASAMESRIILDSAGAEKLVGNGDMLYSPLGGEKKRVQGCYVSPEEIEKVVAFVKGERETAYDDNVLATIDAAVFGQESKEKAAAPEPAEEQDELLPAAVEIALETGQASTSMLQRRLKLGYSRASRLIDQMESKGYVGPFEGSRPRQILITKEQWRELRIGAAPD